MPLSFVLTFAQLSKGTLHVTIVKVCLTIKYEKKSSELTL